MSNYTIKLRSTGLWLIVVNLVLLSGCVTAQQVKEIVEESNQQTVAVLASGDGISMATDVENYTASDDWRATSNRLQSIINSNQDNPTIADPLRLRLAYLLLAAGKKNTAEEVKKIITSAEKFSERDKILYDRWEFFKWWSDHGPEGSAWDSSDTNTEGPKYRSQLFEEAGKDDRDPELRAWLNYTAARVGYRTAISHSSASRLVDELTTTLELYATKFDAEEQDRFASTIKGVKIDSAESYMYLPWIIRAKLVFCDSYGHWSGAGETLETFPAPTWVKDNLDLSTDC